MGCLHLGICPESIRLPAEHAVTSDGESYMLHPAGDCADWGVQQLGPQARPLGRQERLWRLEPLPARWSGRESVIPHR